MWLVDTTQVYPSSQFETAVSSRDTARLDRPIFELAFDQQNLPDGQRNVVFASEKQSVYT